MKAPAAASEKSFAALFSRPGLWSLGEYWLFSGGHDFIRAVNSAKPIRLQPLRPAFAARFRGPQLLGLREYPRLSLGHGFTACRKSPFSIGGRSFSSDMKCLTITGLQPLKKSFSLFSLRLFSHAVTLDEGHK